MGMSLNPLVSVPDDDEFERWKASRGQPTTPAASPPASDDAEFAAWKQRQAQQPPKQSPGNTSGNTPHGATGSWGDGPGIGRTFRDASMAFGSGLTGEFADEIQARMEPGNARQNELVERAGRERFKREHPVANFGLEAAGMVANPIGRGLGVVKGGALFGGAAGLGAGDGSLGERIPGAAVGALAGAGSGALLQHVVAPVGRLGYDLAKSGVQAAKASPALQNAVGFLRAHPVGLSTVDVSGLGGTVPPNASRGVSGLGARIAQQVGQKVDQVAGDLAPRSPNDRANKLLLEKIAADKVRLDELRATMARTGKPVAVGDLAGDNVLGLQRGARSVPSEAKDAIPKALYARAEQQPTRVRADLEQAAGVDAVNAADKAEQLIAQQRANAKPLYERAYAAAPVDHPDVQATLMLPQFQSAFKRAQRIAKVEGVELPSLTKTETVGGKTVTSFNPQSIQSIDYIKRGLDELVESKMRGGAMGRTEARALRNRMKDMLHAVDEIVPEYKQARAQFAGDQELRDALDAGREFSKMDDRAVAQTLRDLSPSAKPLFAQGALDDLTHQIRGTTDGHDVVRKVFGNDLKREALRSLVGDEAFQKLAADMQTETRMLRSKNFTVGGSNTVDKAQEALDIDKAGIPQALLQAATGRFGQAASSLGQSVLLNRMRGVTTETADALAPKLIAGMNGDRQALDDVLKELLQFRTREIQRATTRSTAVRPLTGQIGGTIGGTVSGQRR